MYFRKACNNSSDAVLAHQHITNLEAGNGNRLTGCAENDMVRGETVRDRKKYQTHKHMYGLCCFYVGFVFVTFFEFEKLLFNWPMISKSPMI